MVATRVGSRVYLLVTATIQAGTITILETMLIGGLPPLAEPTLGIMAWAQVLRLSGITMQTRAMASQSAVSKIR